LQTGGAENILRSLLDRGLPGEFLVIHGSTDNVECHTVKRSSPLTAPPLQAVLHKKPIWNSFIQALAI
jgi:hypothetical protein